MRTRTRIRAAAKAMTQKGRRRRKAVAKVARLSRTLTHPARALTHHFCARKDRSKR